MPVDAAAADVPSVDAPTGYPAVVLADQPSGYWRLGDSAGTAVDASGHMATGSYGSGITQGVPGAIANDVDTAVAFNGETGAITLAGGFDFGGTAAFSIEAWIKPNVIDNKNTHVFTKQHRATPRQGYALLLHGLDGITVERFVDDLGTVIESPIMPSTTRFTHVVFTYDGASMRLYVNGQPATPVTETRPQTAMVTEPAVIGAANPTESFFNGAIDEVAIYPVALPAARAQAHYAAGTTP